MAILRFIIKDKYEGKKLSYIRNAAANGIRTANTYSDIFEILEF